jgi:lysophospholipid acyltransferase (LPLAT)-like uncharacterized protein
MSKQHSLHKRIKKALFTNPVTLWVLSRLIANYIRFVYYSSRKHVVMHPDSAPLMRGEENVIFAFWHGRLLLMPMLSPRNRKVHVMISGHHDGMLIAHSMFAFGFGVVEGSSRRGGANAARGAIDVLLAGDNVSITPDGPKGPNMKVQQGAVAIAKLAGKKVVPITYASSRCKRFNSWDRFMVALPFGKVYFEVGAPMTFTSEEQTADIQNLENVMHAITKNVDERAGIIA